MNRETTVWAVLDKNGNLARAEPWGEGTSYEIHQTFESAEIDKMSDERVVEATLIWEQ